MYLQERRLPQITRKLSEVRESLGIGLRPFAREAGVSVSTLQDTEGGRTPRPQTAWKYAEALRRRGVDPNEVEEIRVALGEVLLIPPDAERALSWGARKAWESLTESLVQAGYIAELKQKLEEIEHEHGEEGRRRREQEEEADRRLRFEEQ